MGDVSCSVGSRHCRQAGYRKRRMTDVGDSKYWSLVTQNTVVGDPTYNLKEERFVTVIVQLGCFSFLPV